MPSFDVVSKVDTTEVRNAIDQANREVDTRFDFKGTNAKFDLNGDDISLKAQEKFQIEQMKEILNTKLAKRGVDVASLSPKEINMNNNEARQVITVRQGIDQELAKKITKLIKEKKLKVQASIQGDQVRVTGKKRDDLQDVITFLKEQKLELPLQYENFRD